LITQLKAYWNEMDEKKKKRVKHLLGAVVGAGLGYTYYATIGCASGGCPITSNPLISTLWGAAIGGAVTA
jgi:hypothetical protein